MTDKDLDLIHAKLHGLLMLDKYSPSKFEKDISLIIYNAYKNSCSECKNKLEVLKLKQELELREPKAPKKGFMENVFK